MKKARIENNKIVIYTAYSQITDIVSPQYASEATFEENNYYDVVEPPYDTKTQILVNLHKVEDDKIFTYDVQDLSDEEIAEKQQQDQLEQIKQMNDRFEQDGKEYYNEIKQRITILLIGKENAMDMMQEIKVSVYPMLDQIKVGNYPFALLDYMDGQNNPTISEVVDLFNEIGNYVQEYYTTQYPH